MVKKIGIIGLGYVGLPLLLALSKKFIVMGYDYNDNRVNELKIGDDKTKQISKTELLKINITNNYKNLKECNVFIVTVPTPIKKDKTPDLKHLISASTIISKILKKNDIVIFESTVFPGCTENICGKILEQKSKFKLNKDFFLGYSPERISPGETTKNLKNIVKIVSGSNIKITKIINSIYKKIIKKTFIAKNIKTAEAAKVIENTQRDLNIAFVNELSKIFGKLNLNTYDVLNAASTKWNFNKFEPGIVGGHCIGVDPYYLTHIAKANGYNPNVILAGRKINDGMSQYISKKFIKLFHKKKIITKNSKVLIFGLTFKENCPDIRNSKVFDIINYLHTRKIKIDVIDPWIEKKTDNKRKNYTLINKIKKNYYDGLIFAVKHRQFKKITSKNLSEFCKKKHVIFDIKGQFRNIDATL